MSENPNEQIFDDLFRYLEVLETQNAAILHLLKDKKVVSEKKFASYLEQAAVASDVKWRAARVRMEHLLASVPEPKPEVKAEAAPKTEKASPEAAKPGDKQQQVKKAQQDTTADESRSKSSEARTNQTGQDQRSTNAPEVEAKDAGKVGESDDDNSKNQASGDPVATDGAEKASFPTEGGSKNGARSKADKTKESSAEARELKTQGADDAANVQKTQLLLTEQEQEKVA